MKLSKVIAALALTFCLHAQAQVPSWGPIPKFHYRILSISPSEFDTLRRITTIPVHAIYQNRMVVRSLPATPPPDYIKFSAAGFATYIPVIHSFIIAPDVYIVITRIELIPNMLPGLIGIEAVYTPLNIKSQRIPGILK